MTLDISEKFAANIDIGMEISVRDPEGVVLATMLVADIWVPDKIDEALAVYGTDDRAHPGIRYLLDQSHPIYLGGSIKGLASPSHYDFKNLRHTPNELRNNFRDLGWGKIVAFQTRNPLHRAHQELTFNAAKRVGANLLIHPVVGLTKPGDVNHFTRVRCYQAILDKYPVLTTKLSLLNLAMRMVGPREAVWHGLIRINHLIS